MNVEAADYDWTGWPNLSPARKERYYDLMPFISCEISKIADELSGPTRISVELPVGLFYEREYGNRQVTAPVVLLLGSGRSPSPDILAEIKVKILDSLPVSHVAYCAGGRVPLDLGELFSKPHKLQPMSA